LDVVHDLPRGEDGGLQRLDDAVLHVLSVAVLRAVEPVRVLVGDQLVTDAAGVTPYGVVITARFTVRRLTLPSQCCASLHAVRRVVRHALLHRLGHLGVQVFALPGVEQVGRLGADGVAPHGRQVLDARARRVDVDRDVCG
jgi:hypothetical protein